MTVLLDTNIIMDAVQERSPFDIEAKEILKRSQGGKEFTCLFTANSAADIFYLYSKARDMKSANSALYFLLSNYGVVSVTHEDCKVALTFPIEDFDFEDVLVVVCAQRAGVEYIVARDDKFLSVPSPVELISPKAFVSMLK
ncbi:MAG: PIN domain-containing protein [Oscillospiraceae bacterium]|nr:PIN domain-containing protein [Oscillospiraceae bacterium]